MMDPYAPDSNFTGTPEQGHSILRLFGVVIVFGLGTMVNGTYQIVTGRRNRAITFATLGLAVLLFLVTWLTKRSLGG